MVMKYKAEDFLTSPLKKSGRTNKREMNKMGYIDVGGLCINHECCRMCVME